MIKTDSKYRYEDVIIIILYSQICLPMYKISFKILFKPYEKFHLK